MIRRWRHHIRATTRSDDGNLPHAAVRGVVIKTAQPLRSISGDVTLMSQPSGAGAARRCALRRRVHQPGRAGNFQMLDEADHATSTSVQRSHPNPPGLGGTRSTLRHQPSPARDPSVKATLGRICSLGVFRIHRQTKSQHGQRLSNVESKVRYRAALARYSVAQVVTLNRQTACTLPLSR